MAKAKIPEQARSGQCDPVTGDALSSNEAVNGENSMAASALAITHQNHHRNHQTNQHSTAIRMVPVNATSRTMNSSYQLPPSPPSTPSHSPPTSNEIGPQSWSSEKGDELRQSFSSIAVQEREMPDTPEASPSTISPADAVLRQKGSLSSREFVKEVLPKVLTINEKGQADFGVQAGRYIIEDACMEIVSQTCIGAVLIDTKPTFVAHPTAISCSFSPSTPRTWNQTSSRMSRSSSNNSNASNTGLERPSPRRTLLTRINGIGNQMDSKDLRAHILDVLDHATEKLHVDNIIFVLDRSTLDDEAFRATVHGLIYVGASIIGRGPKEGEPDSQNEERGNPNETIHAPRCVGKNFVLLSVDA